MANDAVKMEPEQQPETDREQIFTTLLKKDLDKKEENNFRKKWSEDEERTILRMREDGETWESIAEQIPNTTPVKCMRRYERMIRVERKWPTEIDEKIIHLHEVVGMGFQDIKNILEGILRLMFRLFDQGDPPSLY